MTNPDQIFTIYVKNNQIHVKKIQEFHFLKIKKIIIVVFSQYFATLTQYLVRHLTPGTMYQAPGHLGGLQANLLGGVWGGGCPPVIKFSFVFWQGRDSTYPVPCHRGGFGLSRASPGRVLFRTSTSIKTYNTMIVHVPKCMTI